MTSICVINDGMPNHVIFWSGVCRVDWNWVIVIWFSIIWVNMIWVNVIHFSSSIFFNFKIILMSSVFVNAFASRVWNDCCIIPQLTSTVGKILVTPEGEVEPPLLGNVWEVVSGVFWWVHPDDIVTTPPESGSSNFSRTLQNSEGDVPIIVSPSIKCRRCLVGVDEKWATCRIFQTLSITP